MEYLKTHRAATSVNLATVVVANAVVMTIIVDVVATVETHVKTVVPTIMNQPLFTSASNRLAAAYPWGMPLDFAS